MRWIFLSPHLDDAALSCGGLIYELARENHDVQIWTVCAGDPPPGRLSGLAVELHLRWHTGSDAPAVRRKEDILACNLLGAAPLHFEIPECIYRRQPGCDLPVISSNAELFQPLPVFEQPLMQQIAALVADHLAPDDILISPLAVGGHIDHHLVRGAAESLGRALQYYPDFPYIANMDRSSTSALDSSWRPLRRSISEPGVDAWQMAVAAYRTQTSTFWANLTEMKSAIRSYRHDGGGGTLWTGPQFAG